jgi:quinoprotein glucose dehydrogenase
MKWFTPLALLQCLGIAHANENWSAYLGDKGARHYSELKQITPENVQSLRPAWTFHSGGVAANNRSQIQCNPLIIDGTLYGTSPSVEAFAIDAQTGKELWRFNPTDQPGITKTGVNRGLMYWADAKSPNDRRIYFANDHFLHALDAATGKRIPSFGKDGSIDLKENMGRDIGGLALNVTSPGVIHGDLLILGMRLGEGPAPAAPGPIRAFNVRTGKLVWRFNTIPLPGEPGHETWPPKAHETIGGANVWTGFALDEARGIVFCPTGSAAFDFWGGNRIGQNLYANCLIALDSQTGKRLWHQQLVHHDLWDRDLPAPPTLITVSRGGKKMDAVAQLTKSGHVFVFNRETGEPVFPIREVPVPGSDLIGEAAWPTQPLPEKPAPFARQLFSYDEITNISPESHRQVLERFSKIRPHTPFAPPSREGTVVLPGFDGGAEWGGAAADRDGVLYVNANEMAWILTMVENQKTNDSTSMSGETIFTQICAACHGLDRMGNKAQNVPPLSGIEQRLKKADVLAILKAGKGVMPSFGFLNATQQEMVADYLLGTTATSTATSTAATKAAQPEKAPQPYAGAAQKGTTLGQIPYTTTGYNRWLDANGYPAIKPPWGTLNAIDLNTGEYLWRTPLGEFPELTAKGVPTTGTENYGGPVVTAGGLVFIAASKDEHLRAFDKKTGQELWKFKLPAAGYATPSTYSVNGRQYVVIACGGGKCGTPSGDAYMAFCLP